jgi:hypothetical protein
MLDHFSTIIIDSSTDVVALEVHRLAVLAEAISSAAL